MPRTIGGQGAKMNTAWLGVKVTKIKDVPDLLQLDIDEGLTTVHHRFLQLSCSDFSSSGQLQLF